MLYIEICIIDEQGVEERKRECKCDAKVTNRKCIHPDV